MPKQPLPNFEPGDRVRITRGPHTGEEGTVRNTYSRYARVQWDRRKNETACPRDSLVLVGQVHTPTEWDADQETLAELLQRVHEHAPAYVKLAVKQVLEDYLAEWGSVSPDAARFVPSFNVDDASTMYDEP